MNVSDRELVTRAQKGESAAFEALVFRYDRQVLSIAASFTGDPDEAKDIYQDVFIRVFRSLPDFEFRSEFSTWLYRIVTNVCLNYKTRNARRAYTPLEGEIEAIADTSGHFKAAPPKPAAPDEHAQNVEITEHVEVALATLSPQQRLVFTLKHSQGYKLREIAAMLECSEGTVKRYLFTATNKLRKRLRNVFK